MLSQQPTSVANISKSAWRTPKHGFESRCGHQRRWTLAPSSSPEKPWRSIKRSSGRSSRTSPSATRDRVRAAPHPNLAPPRPDRIGTGARRTPSCWRREVAFVLRRPIHRSMYGGGLSRLACRSPEKVADVHCGIGSSGVPRPSLGGYVTGAGATRGATAAGGC